ncbi:MAG: YicC family protein [Nitrospirae bacterium]|nr:YicC family protein [Nitrospirota bacterium]
MTGFGASEKDGLRVEIRSLNHRFMEMSFRLSPMLTEHEMPLRNMLKEKFSRGKFDVSISIDSRGKARLKLNTGVAKEIYNSLNTLKSELGIPGDIAVETLLNYRELFITEEPEYDTSLLYDAFREAIVQLEKMRTDEGSAIAADISGRADRLEAINKELVLLGPAVEAVYKKKFHDRIKELLAGVESDRDRMFQEAAILIEKTDTTEELTRIENHLRQFKKLLLGGDTVGKRLDFLLQELNREVNTIASKAVDYRISDIIIEMKSEIEKMREQGQNIQ